MFNAAAAGHDALTILQGFKQCPEMAGTTQHLSSMHGHALSVRVSWITARSNQPQIIDAEIGAETRHTSKI